MKLLFENKMNKQKIKHSLFSLYGFLRVIKYLKEEKIMKFLLNKKFKSIFNAALSVLIIVFTMLLFFSKIKFSEIEEYNLFQLIELNDFYNRSLYSLIIVILMGVNVILCVVSYLWSLKRRRRIIIGYGSTIVSSSVVIALLFVSHIATIVHLAFAVLQIVIAIIGIVYFIIYSIKNKDEVEEVDDEKKKNYKVCKAISIVLSIFALASTILMLFFPLYQAGGDLTGIKFYPINFFLKGGPLEHLVMALTILMVNVVNIIYLVSNISYLGNFEAFMRKSKNFINFNFSISLLYFVSFYIVSCIITLINDGTTIIKLDATYSFIPSIIVVFDLIAFSILEGKYLSKRDKDIVRMKFPRLEMLIYNFLFLGAVAGVIFINFLTVEVNGVENISLTIFNLIRDAENLPEGYLLLTFFIKMFLVLCVTLTVFTIASFASKNRMFYKISIVSLVINFIFIFFVGVFGKYYEITQAMNKEMLAELFSKYGFIVTFPEMEITSQALYVFLGATVLFILVLIRNPLKDNTLKDEIEVFTSKNEGSEALQLAGGVKASNIAPVQEETQNPKVSEVSQSEPKEEVVNSTSKEEVKEEVVTFDPCPAFSELDDNIPQYQERLEELKTREFKNPTLTNICKFVVEYARDSRLHLSYSMEDIATFVAGLGSTRLSILQGMSGTGKTSLPKIFLEALSGDCDIVEVESSWRDKNELLGYYNEFSKTYTPKKFTQYLYRAKLNSDVLTFIVLDEMNLSRIEYYFSDFLSLMENEEDKREIKLLNTKIYNTVDNEVKHYQGLVNDHTLKIPANVYFIGTANRDESTFEISDKVYDRAHTMNFNKRAPKINKFEAPKNPLYLPYSSLKALLDKAKADYDFDLDKVDFVKEVEQLLLPYNISFGNRILRQIEDFVKVYCSCFYDGKNVEKDAIEKILLTKVVAKLENKSVENKEYLASEFAKLGLSRCAEFISKLNED